MRRRESSYRTRQTKAARDAQHSRVEALAAEKHRAGEHDGQATKFAPVCALCRERVTA